MASQNELIGLVIAVFLIAVLYSSVGFGGGSSYLAILTLVFSSFFVIRSSALLCNLVVVSGSCILYHKKGHLKIKEFLPFILTSIPLAFIGATFRLKEHVFFIILGASLITSSIALIVQTLQAKKDDRPKSYPKYVSYLLGGAIGLLSGLVGIGGGIFLAPVLNHLKWNKPIVIAALASFFILMNSASGIIGLLHANTFEVPMPEILYLVAAVLVGGQLGVRLSLGKLSGHTIRYMTAALVFFVGLRVLLTNGLQLELFS